MSRWFRMYDELLDDPKVQRLSGDEFKAWVNILCLASRGDGAVPNIADIAFALRFDPKKAAKLVGSLVANGLLQSGDGDGYSPHKWSERQFKSDVSTDRVKRFRERSKKPEETKTETAPDTDTETDSSVDKSTDKVVPLETVDQRFWREAKSFIGASESMHGHDVGKRIGKWLRDYGKADTASAITSAQIERAVDGAVYVEGVLRKRGPARGRQAAEAPC